jgi:hypothetical protein
MGASVTLRRTQWPVFAWSFRMEMDFMWRSVSLFDRVCNEHVQGTEKFNGKRVTVIAVIDQRRLRPDVNQYVCHSVVRAQRA